VIPVLDVQHLSVRIRTADGGHVHAVDDVSCQVQAGEIVSVVGESGCGKTMLAMSIIGLLPSGAEVTSGEVRLDGEDLRKASAARLRSVRGSRIGTIFQEPMSALNPVLTVGDQIGEVLRRHESLDRAAARRRAVELLDLVGVAEARRRAGQYPHEMSGGMAQRAVIAMAIACRPRLLLADEPTTALDVTIQAAVLRVLDDLRRQMDMGVLLITHDLGVVADAADRVLVMYAGRVVERAGVNDLFSAPQHPYTLGLLGAARHPARTRPRSRLAEIPGIVPTMRAPATDCSFAPRCSRADDVCRSVRPELASSDSALDHAVACFHPGRR
jgi:peptide/nickel transport system ATP-binding protein